MSRKSVLKRKWFLRFQEGNKIQWCVWKWAVYEWDDYFKRMTPTFYDTEAEARRFFRP